MGFQQPPSLPDYSKLLFELNNSGAQKWNPAVYDILKKLIAAVQQSQNVIVGGTATASAFNGVLVDPNGAILGDGLATPLKCQVDGTTIQIIADTLVATSGLIAFGASSTTLFCNGVAGASGFSVAANTALLTIAPVPGSVIMPIAMYVSVNQNDNGHNDALWSPNAAIDLVYNMTGFPVITTSSVQCLQTIVGSHLQTSINQPVAAMTAGATLDAFLGVGVIARTNNTSTSNSTANKFMHAGCAVAVAYLVASVGGAP